jgi:hypothetical protein
MDRRAEHVAALLDAARTLDETTKARRRPQGSYWRVFFRVERVFASRQGGSRDFPAARGFERATVAGKRRHLGALSVRPSAAGVSAVSVRHRLLLRDGTAARRTRVGAATAIWLARAGGG